MDAFHYVVEGPLGGSCVRELGRVGKAPAPVLQWISAPVVQVPEFFGLGLLESFLNLLLGLPPGICGNRA